MTPFERIARLNARVTALTGRRQLYGVYAITFGDQWTVGADGLGMKAKAATLDEAFAALEEMLCTRERAEADLAKTLGIVG
jgi:hypothetical protein